MTGHAENSVGVASLPPTRRTGPAVWEAEGAGEVVVRLKCVREGWGKLCMLGRRRCGRKLKKEVWEWLVRVDMMKKAGRGWRRWRCWVRLRSLKVLALKHLEKQEMCSVCRLIVKRKKKVKYLVLEHNLAADNKTRGRSEKIFEQMLFEVQTAICHS